eukprot:scaffold77505_cov52-Attheya_sp.AAC.1
MASASLRWSQQPRSGVYIALLFDCNLCSLTFRDFICASIYFTGRKDERERKLDDSFVLKSFNIMDFISGLPDDVGRHILGFLDVPTLVQKKIVCRSWCTLFTNTVQQKAP